MRLECILATDPRGVSYKGFKQTTSSGRICQKWSSETPHSPWYVNIDNLIDKFGAEELETNYCRNPLAADDQQRPWCYTTDPDVRWEFCDIPDC